MINRVVLVGRTTKEIDLRYTNSNVAVAQFTLAVNRTIKSEGQPDADFVNCVAWRNQAENMSKYVKKGSLIGVDGRIQTRSYDDATGKRVYVTEVVAESVQFLEPKGNKESNQPQQYHQTQAQTGNSQFDTGFDLALDISDDDLPF